MKERISNRDFFIKYGFLMAIITVVFLILVYSALVSRKAWSKGLKIGVERVLEEKNPNQWILGNEIQISGPMSMNSVCYSARNLKDGCEYKAVMIRVATFYGSQAAVFICDQDNNVEFVGYSSIHGRIKDDMISAKSDKRIEYWQKKIPELFQK